MNLALNQHVTLSDGRKIGFAEYGDPHGKPMLYFHGTPGSRLEQHPDHTIASALGLHIIAPDRPGYGISDVQTNRTLLDWAVDITQLMDALEIEHCPILGFSGGGPFAMACAHQLPDRCSMLGLVSSVAPFDNSHGTQGMNSQSEALYQLALADPQAFSAQIDALVTDGDTLFQIMTSALPDIDQAVFSQQLFKKMYLSNMREAIYHSVDGTVSDMLLFPRAWGFSPQDISCKTLLWQGEGDCNVPSTMGRFLSETIPHCTSYFIPNSGHYLLFTRWREILKILSDSE